MDPMTLKLAALRLAPIQCASWGHPETSGLPTIDYYLSSDFMEPPNGHEHYTEQLVRLPNLSIYYTPIKHNVIETNRETFGLRKDSLLYHCCLALYKFLPQYDEMFPRIAQQVGDCQFLFSSYPFIPDVLDKFYARIKNAFARFDLDANNYVVFLPLLNQDQYASLNRLCDIYLDSIGWSGCNSSLEALAWNLPVITLPGLLMRSRDTAAILTLMGVTETIASSLDEYIEIAAKLGQDREYRIHISKKIDANKHRVYQDKACISALEEFLEEVVRRKI
jgi:predicted O-linked N-acetylglucosamine transferase (SPINDLY family)